jgi:hypothetical protein
VAVFARNADTGVIDDVPLACVDGLGEVSAVVFGECDDEEGSSEGLGEERAEEGS